jgi:hypothetical protein
MKTEWTAERSTLAMLIPNKLKAQVKDIFSLADKRDNGFVTIRIGNVHRPRTTGERSQNHHINGHIQQIATETGNPFDVVKLEVKHRAIDMGYPMLEQNGEVRMDLYGRPMGISESDSSVEECAILIEAAHMLAAELGIVLEESEEER